MTMKLMFTNASSSAIRSLRPVRPTRSGLAVSVTGLLAIGLLLQGVAAGQKPTVAVYPASTYLTNSQTQQFTAVVSGTTNTGVNWSVNPAVGTVSSTGLYTAPASISSGQTVTVKATSAADPTQSASASVALAPPVTVSLSPLT